MPTILTIGYQQATQAAVLSALRAAGVEVAAKKGDRATLRRVYAGQLELPEALAHMAELRELALEKRTCLLCYCRAADKCHRSLLVAALLEDFEVVDLEPALVA